MWLKFLLEILLGEILLGYMACMPGTIILDRDRVFMSNRVSDRIFQIYRDSVELQFGLPSKDRRPN